MSIPVAVGIIHARGGSKRVPLKNIKLLGDKPLIAWVVEAACQARTLSRVIVSTDHDGIAKVAENYGAEVPFRRPVELAEDVPSELVTQHAVRYMEEKGYSVDIALTLQPTTPFIRPQDIDACVEKLIATGADSVVTVSAVRERPEWMLRIGEGERLEPFLGRWWSSEEGISQNLPQLYVPNGGACATRREVLMGQNRIIGNDTRAVVMPLENSVDIDEMVDFAFAEAVLAAQKKQGNINE